MTGDHPTPWRDVPDEYDPDGTDLPHTTGFHMVDAAGADVLRYCTYCDCVEAEPEVRARIVRAVNCHEELLAACEGLLSLTGLVFEMSGYSPDSGHHDVLDRARAVIAKARGRPES